MHLRQSISLKDECFSTSKSSIIQWVNSTLNLSTQTQLQSIEQLGQGSIYCQIIALIHPPDVPLQKVSLNPKTEKQFISNLKLLQTVFDRVGIKKQLGVERLAQKKYAENLRLIQWLKGYYESRKGKISPTRSRATTKTKSKSEAAVQEESQLTRLKKQINKNETKLGMIKEIIKCCQYSETKIEIIEEILKMGV